MVAEKLQNAPPVGYNEPDCEAQVIGNVGQDGPTQVFFGKYGICKFYFDNEYIALFLV